jgi:hypothetical protein
LKNDPDPQLDPDPYVIGPPGPASRFVSQRYGSEIRIRTKMSRIRNAGEQERKRVTNLSRFRLSWLS